MRSDEKNVLHKTFMDWKHMHAYAGVCWVDLGWANRFWATWVLLSCMHSCIYMHVDRSVDGKLDTGLSPCAVGMTQGIYSAANSWLGVAVSTSANICANAISKIIM